VFGASGDVCRLARNRDGVFEGIGVVRLFKQRLFGYFASIPGGRDVVLH
jgi:hypothetical protein